jgi:hypothetical protein
MSEREPMSYADMMEQDDGPRWQPCRCSGIPERPMCSDARRCPLHVDEPEDEGISDDR